MSIEPNCNRAGGMWLQPWAEGDNWLLQHELYSTDEWLKIKSQIEPLAEPFVFRDVVPALMIVAGNYYCACITRNADRIVGFKYRSSKNRARLKKAFNIIQKIKALIFEQRPLNRNDLSILKKANNLLTQRSLLLQATKDSPSGFKNIAEWLASHGKQEINIGSCWEVLNDIQHVLLQHMQRTSQGGAPSKHERSSVIKGLIDIWVEYTGTQPAVFTNRETDELGGRFVNFVYAVLTPLAKQTQDVTDMIGMVYAIKKECLLMHKK
ncbi:MAG: hypothetical protein EB059_01700 [Alphaproteobacteria bacterium]|nr:hypothetical protein [Alphaproteobacteria bacterium]